jgi:hypothetical protein
MPCIQLATTRVCQQRARDQHLRDGGDEHNDLEFSAALGGRQDTLDQCHACRVTEEVARNWTNNQLTDQIPNQPVLAASGDTDGTQ